MTALGKILAFCAAIVVVGALLAPPLYWAGQWLVDAELIPQLRGFAFHRYLSRAIMVLAVGGLWPLLRWLGIRSFDDLRLRPNPQRWADLGRGVVIAVAGLWLAAGMVLLSGRMAFDSGLTNADVAGKIGSALVTGVLVAVIEETFFRGALFGVLRQRLPWPWALGLLSLLFGIVHFIKPNRGATPIEVVEWTSGFALLPSAFSRFGDPALLLSGLATLVLFGWILGYAVLRTESLFLAIGLHGGWVFALRCFTKTTHRVGEPDLWLGKTMRIGLVPMVMLGLSGLVIWWLLRGRRTI